MQYNVNINEKTVEELFQKFKTNDLNNIINNLLHDALEKKKGKIEDFFGKVDYVEDYDYKSLRNRNESID
ncbi:MAG: type II toxin-antitoxin system VapB family antitoxin [Candidatus Kapabacteria bacterium]|nr:type II toxin-antitoxin system VapB family antitoxin [Candidatus Kapabacteria bacterium]